MWQCRPNHQRMRRFAINKHGRRVMARTSQPPVRPRSTSSKTRMPPGSEAGPSDLEGARAPDFTLPDQDDKPVSLRALRQRGDVVLYFYPKDMTPGCTTEACSFRDNLKQLQA